MNSEFQIRARWVDPVNEYRTFGTLRAEKSIGYTNGAVSLFIYGFLVVIHSISAFMAGFSVVLETSKACKAADILSRRRGIGFAVRLF
jgi:hypothetical protein